MLCVDERLFVDLLLFGLCILAGKVLSIIFSMHPLRSVIYLTLLPDMRCSK